MRAAVMSLMLVAPAALAQGSPAALAGVRFAAVEPDDAGADVAFVAPGEVAFFDGETRRQCSFTAEGSGYLWALRLKCGADQVERQWTWLPSGTAWTDLVTVPGGELTRAGEVPASASATVPAKATVARPKALTFESFAGRWTNGADAALEISSSGEVKLGAVVAKARLRACVHVQVEERPEIPCLSFRDEGGKEIAFGLLDGFAWVEGRVRRDEGRALFEGWRGGRFFRRAR